jgi:8-oxo-dGTP diphosphatase
MPPKLFYIGIKGLIVKDNKVLVLRHNETDYWDIPGGRISEGEEISETLQRELSEELPSIKNIIVNDLLYVYRLPRNLSDGNGLILLMYKVTAQLDSVELSHEHRDFRWVSKEEVELLGKGDDQTQIEEGYREALRRAFN